MYLLFIVIAVLVLKGTSLKKTYFVSYIYIYICYVMKIQNYFFPMLLPIFLTSKFVDSP